MEIVKEMMESEMIAEILKAEIMSPRWKKVILKILQEKKVNISLLTSPNIDNAGENELRKEIAALYRGYTMNSHLFAGFPIDTKWVKAIFSKEELKNSCFMKYDYWLKATHETRKPDVLVENINSHQILDSKVIAIKKIANKIKDKRILPNIIFVAKDAYSQLILLEGHFRLTAMLLAYDYLPSTIECIVGFSPRISNWKYY